MTLKTILILFSLGFILLLLPGCAPGSGYSTEAHPAGFFTGIWHGWIAPVTLIWGLFNPDIRIYEIFNTGWWYDFGFYMAIIGGFGGLSLFRRSKKEKKY
jgi:hypothetical protein